MNLTTGEIFVRISLFCLLARKLISEVPKR